MALVFPSPDPMTTVGFIKWLQWISGLTDVGQGSVLGIMILLVIGASLFFIMKSFKTESALGVSMLITSVMGALLRVLSLVNDYVLYVCIILFIASLFYMKKEAANQEF